MSLQVVETLLGVKAEDDSRISQLYLRYNAQLLARLKRSKSAISAVPTELEYIVEELTIARFNRLGSEGISSENLDGHSATYEDINLFSYEADISAYLTQKLQGTFKFL